MPYEEDEEQELSLLDIFQILWRRKWLIVLLSLLFGGVATFRAFTAPFIYRAECRILPPGGRGGGQIGGLADFVGLSGASTSGNTLVGILKGASVVDTIIARFDLMEKMNQDIRLRARAAVLGSLEATEEKGGIISIAYLSTDPQEAADIANAFVEVLQKKVQDLAVNDAQQRRAFFENQLLQAQQELNAAEADMINYQQSRGVIAFESQTGALLASINSLRNRIAAKNVEISTLSGYAGRDNPRLRLAQSELDAMNRELKKLEEEQLKTDRRGRDDANDLLSSVGQVPEMSVEYQRYVRALRFATTKYELMLRQYENARINEASDLSTIVIIDKAQAPDWKYRPQRARMVLLGGASGFCLGVFLAFILEHIRSIREAKKAKEDDYED